MSGGAFHLDGFDEAGNLITARVEAEEVDRDKNRVRFKTTCTNQEGTLVLDGHAVVSPPKAKQAGD